jgi:ATP-dependent DNA helicase RecG
MEVQALVTADIEGYVDNARMRQFTGFHAADITKILQGLGSLKEFYDRTARGDGRNTHCPRYRLPTFGI